MKATPPSLDKMVAGTMSGGAASSSSGSAVAPAVNPQVIATPLLEEAARFGLGSHIMQNTEDKI